MENIRLNLSNLHEFGPAFYEYLKLRKQFFVDTLGWDIPHDDDVEMDQYDTPQAHYSIVLSNGKVAGGARTMPTTSAWGDYTYMLRDAVDGKLGSIPSDLVSGVVASPLVWECTRIVISDDLKGLAERARCLELIVEGFVRTAVECGARQLIGLTRPGLARSLRQYGYDVTRISRTYRSEGDGHVYAVLSMPPEKVAQRMAA